MRKLFFYIILVIVVFLTNEVSAQKTIINEVYYAVNEQGQIDKKIITEKRKLVYDKNRGLISVHSSFPSGNNPKSAAEKYFNLPETGCRDNKGKCNEKNRIIKYCESPDDQTTLTHYYQYNEEGDLIEDKSILTDNRDKPISTTILSYEYIYPGPPIDSKGIKKKAKTNGNTEWVLRTIKKDGLIVQQTERKFRNKK